MNFKTNVSLFYFISAVIFILLFHQNSACFGWGGTVHKWIAYQAITQLNNEVDKSNPIIKNADKIAAAVMKPDQRKRRDRLEEPKHFINLELYFEYGYSLQRIPWKISDMENKLSSSKIFAFGCGPWAIENTLNELVAALKKNDKKLIIEKAADLAHYVGDLHQPLHTTDNYNGQRTGNYGVHSRFENDLMDAYYLHFKTPEKLKLKIIDDVSLFTFKELKKTFSKLPIILRADSKAQWEPGIYDGKYYSRFWEETQDTVNEILTDSSNALALYYYTAIKRSLTLP